MHVHPDRGLPVTPAPSRALAAYFPPQPLGTIYAGRVIAERAMGRMTPRSFRFLLVGIFFPKSVRT